MGHNQVAHLSSSIKQLAEQNARLNTRLLASLDALSVASGTTVNAYNDENEALRLLNHNLALRLHDAQQKQSELRDAIASMTEPGKSSAAYPTVILHLMHRNTARAVNNESAKQRARMVANEHIHCEPLISVAPQMASSPYALHSCEDFIRNSTRRRWYLGCRNRNASQLSSSSRSL